MHMLTFTLLYVFNFFAWNSAKQMKYFGWVLGDSELASVYLGYPRFGCLDLTFMYRLQTSFFNLLGFAAPTRTKKIWRHSNIPKMTI